MLFTNSWDCARPGFPYRLSSTKHNSLYAYELAGEITNLNKLIIQFIQALGEGFNFTYHDDIFHSKKKSDTQTNNTNDTNIINNNIERYEEEKNNKYAESFRNYGLKTFDRYNNNSPQII